MTVEILSPEKKVFSGEADIITCPGLDGSFQLKNNHAPLISALKKGALIVKSEKGENTFSISGGFVEMLNNKVSVLVESAE